MRQVLQPRDDAEADRAHGDADGIEEPADRAARHAGDEERVEQVVLRALVGVRLVRLDARAPRPCLLGKSHAEEVVERAEGADPAAEDAPEDQREREQPDAPEQPAVDGVRRQQRHRRDERIGEQEPLDRQRQAHGRVGARREAPAERRLEEEVEEEGEEPDLRRRAAPT